MSREDCLNADDKDDGDDTDVISNVFGLDMR